MQRIVTVWLVLSIFGAAPVASQEAGWLSGVVTDRETGGRLGGAVVSITPGGRSVVTSADGAITSPPYRSSSEMLAGASPRSRAAACSCSPCPS